MTLQVIYDLHVNPASYDFPMFLASAEAHRRGTCWPDMDVHFVPGMGKTYAHDYNPEGFNERDELFWRVCVPSCRLLNTVRSVLVYGERVPIESEHKYPQTWTLKDPVKSHGSQYLVDPPRCFSATAKAREWAERFPQPFVTMTIREAAYDEKRNSDRLEWLMAARRIKEAGIEPIFVPDTYGSDMPEFQNCRIASLDIDLRLALYEQAAMNLGVGNGPMTLCILSECRFVMFTDRMGTQKYPNGVMTPEKPDRTSIASYAIGAMRKAA